MIDKAITQWNPKKTPLGMFEKHLPIQTNFLVFHVCFRQLYSLYHIIPKTLKKNYQNQFYPPNFTYYLTNLPHHLKKKTRFQIPPGSFTVRPRKLTFPIGKANVFQPSFFRGCIPLHHLPIPSPPPLDAHPPLRTHDFNDFMVKSFSWIREETSSPLFMWQKTLKKRKKWWKEFFLQLVGWISDI